MMWDHGDWWHFGWGGPLHWVVAAVFWGLLAYVAIRFFLASRRSDGGGVATPSALAILKARYARGELSREQYRAMREEITA